MEYKVNTHFNIGDKLYSLDNSGNISTYHVSKILIKLKDNCNKVTTDIKYTISDSQDKIMVYDIDASEIQRKLFLDKKDIVKHIMDQL